MNFYDAAKVSARRRDDELELKCQFQGVHLDTVLNSPAEPNLNKVTNKYFFPLRPIGWEGEGLGEVGLSHLHLSVVQISSAR